MPVAAVLTFSQSIPICSFHREWLAIITSLLAWLFFLPVLWQKRYLFMPRTALLPLVLMAFIGVQTRLLPVVNIQHAQMAMLYLLWVTLLMVLVKLLVVQTSRQQVSQWFAIGLMMAAVCSSLQELQFRLKGFLGWWGGLGQYNSYGDLIALGTASALYLYALSKPAQRFYLALPAFICILGLSLTPSRSVLLYWLAASVISWYLRRDNIRYIFTAFVVYLMLQGLWLLDLFPAPTAVERFYEQRSGVSARWHIYKVAWALFTDSPWLGQGFGQFDWAYFQAGQFIPELPTRVEHGHNLFLHLLAELGIFPVLVLLGLLGLWLKSCDLFNKQVRHNTDTVSFYIWLLMLCAILGIHSLLEYPLWFADFLGIAAVLLTLGETRCWHIPLNHVFSTVLSVFIVAGIALASLHERHYFKIEYALVHGFNKKVVAEGQQAVIKAPLLTPYIAIIYSVLNEAEATDANKRADLTKMNDLACHFSPNPFLIYQKAQLQALNGFPNEAEKTMTAALAAYPNQAKEFVDGLEILSEEDQHKTDFLKKMATNSFLHTKNVPL